MSSLSASRKSIFCFCLALIITGSLAFLAHPARSADAVVGTGSAASCTEAAFDTAFNNVQSSGGGIITFNCGAPPHTIVLSYPRSVSQDTEIRGAGRITLSGGNSTSLFQVFAAQTMKLDNLILTRAHGTAGAVENFGTLVIQSSRLIDNHATNSGGAISNYGSLTITNSTISDNTADQYGGGINVEGGNVSITGSKLSGNQATLGGGGVQVEISTDVTIAKSQFLNNRSTSNFAEGGGIRSLGTLVISDTLMTENNSSRGGMLMVMDGSAQVLQSLFRGNWASYGGAIRQTGGSLTLTDVTLSGNGYAANGTKITTGGGGISLDGGSATLSRVTLNNNWASYGGGLELDSGTLSLTNVTFSGNSAVGGGAVDQGGGSATLTNVTITGNSAPFFAGGYANRAGLLSVKNVLLSENLNPNNSQSTNCYLPIASNSFSLSSDATCGFGANRDNADLPVRPLNANGGFTWTHLLKPGSDAIDGGTGPGCPTADQRDVARPQGAACDVGAVEVTPNDLLARIFLPLTRK